MLEEDQVTLEPESSDEGPLGGQDTEPQGEPETPPARSEDGAATEKGPEVDWQAELAKRDQAFNKLMSEHQRTAAEVQRYRDAEAAAMAEIQKDRDKYIDRISDPVEGPKFIQQMFQRELDAIRQQERQDEANARYAAESTKAFNDLKTYASKDAGMTPEEFQVFLYQNVDPNTGKPFGYLPPQRALEHAKALIRDRYHDRFAQKQQALADKNADAKAKQKMARQLPSASGVGGREEEPPKTIIDEIMNEEVRTRDFLT